MQEILASEEIARSLIPCFTVVELYLEVSAPEANYYLTRRLNSPLILNDLTEKYELPSVKSFEEFLLQFDYYHLFSSLTNLEYRKRRYKKTFTVQKALKEAGYVEDYELIDYLLDTEKIKSSKPHICSLAKGLWHNAGKLSSYLNDFIGFYLDFSRGDVFNISLKKGCEKGISVNYFLHNCSCSDAFEVAVGNERWDILRKAHKLRHSVLCINSFASCAAEKGNLELLKACFEFEKTGSTDYIPTDIVAIYSEEIRRYHIDDIIECALRKDRINIIEYLDAHMTSNILLSSYLFSYECPKCLDHFSTKFSLDELEATISVHGQAEISLTCAQFLHAKGSLAIYPLEGVKDAEKALNWYLENIGCHLSDECQEWLRAYILGSEFPNLVVVRKLVQLFSILVNADELKERFSTNEQMIDWIESLDGVENSSLGV